MPNNSEEDPEMILTDIVEMLPDGSLSISEFISEAGEDAYRARSWIADAGTKQFVFFSARHRVSRPGQIAFLTRKLVQGVWLSEESRIG